MQTQKQKAQELIERIARDLGHKPRTIQKWRERGWVPHMHRYSIAQHAVMIGEITLKEDFDRFGYGWKKDSAA